MEGTWVCGERLRSCNASMLSLHVLMNDVECVRVSFLGCEGRRKIQDEIFKKLIDVSKKAGMPHTATLGGMMRSNEN